MPDIAERKVIKVGDIDTGAMVDAERVRLDAAIANENLDELITTYPIRESEALGRIAKSLRFPTRTDYERAVLKLLKDDPEAVQFTRGLFGDLANELDAK